MDDPFSIIQTPCRQISSPTLSAFLPIQPILISIFYHNLRTYYEASNIFKLLTYLGIFYLRKSTYFLLRTPYEKAIFECYNYPKRPSNPIKIFPKKIQKLISRLCKSVIKKSRFNLDFNKEGNKKKKFSMGQPTTESSALQHLQIKKKCRYLKKNTACSVCKYSKYF